MSIGQAYAESAELDGVCCAGERGWIRGEARLVREVDDDRVQVVDCPPLAP